MSSTLEFLENDPASKLQARTHNTHKSKIPNLAFTARRDPSPNRLRHMGPEVIGLVYDPFRRGQHIQLPGAGGLGFMVEEISVQW
uniref:Uncharacterized protein n=1 Tax=Moniliophthora roreri TaxID=221103 RepID=A0A0W0GCW2_MONRR